MIFYLDWYFPIRKEQKFTIPRFGRIAATHGSKFRHLRRISCPNQPEQQQHPYCIEWKAAPGHCRRQAPSIVDSAGRISRWFVHTSLHKGAMHRRVDHGMSAPDQSFREKGNTMANPNAGHTGMTERKPRRGAIQAVAVAVLNSSGRIEWRQTSVADAFGGSPGWVGTALSLHPRSTRMPKTTVVGKCTQPRPMSATY